MYICIYIYTVYCTGLVTLRKIPVYICTVQDLTTHCTYICMCMHVYGIIDDVLYKWNTHILMCCALCCIHVWMYRMSDTQYVQYVQDE